MANHVSGYLSVRSISEEGQKVWDEYVVGTLEKYSDRSVGVFDAHLGYFIADSVTEDGDLLNEDGEQLTRSDMCDKIGAKWAYAEDYDESGMSLQSAWSPVLEFADMVAKKIGEVDKSVQLVLTYEDEFPNFVGVTTFTHKGLDTDECIEWTELCEYMREKDEDLAKLWDEEEEDWSDEDEAREILWEVQWEYIHAWQADNELWSVV